MGNSLVEVWFVDLVLGMVNEGVGFYLQIYCYLVLMKTLMVYYYFYDNLMIGVGNYGPFVNFQ